MIDFQYLQTGLYGLGNAHKAGTMAGHLGAAVVAGYFFGEDQSDLPDEVFRGIEGEIKRVIAGEESFWWNAKQAGVTPADLFKPLPKEEPKPDTITVAPGKYEEHILLKPGIILRSSGDDTKGSTQGIFGGSPVGIFPVNDLRNSTINEISEKLWPESASTSSWKSSRSLAGMPR